MYSLLQLTMTVQCACCPEDTAVPFGITLKIYMFKYPRADLESALPRNPDPQFCLLTSAEQMADSDDDDAYKARRPKPKHKLSSAPWSDETQQQQPVLSSDSLMECTRPAQSTAEQSRDGVIRPIAAKIERERGNCKIEIQHSCSQQQETADLAVNSQPSRAQVVLCTGRRGAN